MESISELRRICQSTRPSIFSDFLSCWYYKVSIYFTWICLKLEMSANQVTVLSGVVAVIGGLMLASDSKILVITGVLCFHLFAILDMCDGEVARYRKQGGVAGHYLDWFMHFISSTALVGGLFLASWQFIQSMDSLIVVCLGLSAVVTPILDKCVQNAGWTVICWTRLRDIQKKAEGPCADKSPSVNKSTSLFERSKFARRIRFLVLVPLQDHYISTVLLMIAGLDLALEMFGMPFLNYRFLLLLYIGVVGPFHIYFGVRHMVTSDALVSGYRRVACPSREIRLPEDDFLG
ncbi:MAG: CDP-alcohol phosphatidyltransferase family protein [Desulfobulbaceae bacterium]|nr:CDP-alcohol phosphatidyltransferase family protein [Desulfobulbaceae bacterium]